MNTATHIAANAPLSSTADPSPQLYEAARFNALKHGILSRYTVLSHESHADQAKRPPKQLHSVKKMHPYRQHSKHQEPSIHEGCGTFHDFSYRKTHSTCQMISTKPGD